MMNVTFINLIPFPVSKGLQSFVFRRDLAGKSLKNQEKLSKIYGKSRKHLLLVRQTWQKKIHYNIKLAVKLHSSTQGNNSFIKVINESILIKVSAFDISLYFNTGADASTPPPPLPLLSRSRNINTFI